MLFRHENSKFSFHLYFHWSLSFQFVKLFSWASVSFFFWVALNEDRGMNHEDFVGQFAFHLFLASYSSIVSIFSRKEGGYYSAVARREDDVFAASTTKVWGYLFWGFYRLCSGSAVVPFADNYTIHSGQKSLSILASEAS